MQTGEHWRNVFENWPESIPRKGILVTTQGESIPFVNYLLSEGILLVERDTPDSLGARKVMLTFASIAAVKITAPLELARFQVMGFQAPL
ncbi:MAG: hypothetical protein ACE37I_20470 [Rubinisphaera brasiliensis]|uniref:Uncharacterized protein n=1 Tax=Rubinisphaera brasiliensis (strain ATCC 49424 / DSM 5305 / JCM 21570 / IAM 15109 / NBRC 103401 / IFAM 1448) TaxID=756272 RepID=F0SNN8_RUBBR|nr:hypothetical protein [Rubinisphaera brasiliensis]ADY58924.1 hypothetical protein Plabr_1312 [Rubinisphaera brasiliensis DSM 5305]MBR9800246.1 hypothetical protein [bacterium]